MKLVVVLLLVFQPYLGGNITLEDNTHVFLCTGENVKKYHLSDDCRGLNACNHDIVEITLLEAKEKELTLCAWEDELHQ